MELDVSNPSVVNVARRAATEGLAYDVALVAGCVLHGCQRRITIAVMKSLTVRLPDALMEEIEAESRERRRSKSDVVRERLSLVAKPRSRPALLSAVADLIGSVDGLPADLSGRTKAYLRTTGYGRKRAR